MSSYLTNKRIKNSTQKYDKRTPGTSYGALANMQSFPQPNDMQQTINDLRDFVSNRENSYKKCFSRALPSTEGGINSVARGGSLGAKQQYTKVQMPILDIISLTKPAEQSSETRDDSANNYNTYEPQPMRRLAQTI